MGQDSTHNRSYFLNAGEEEKAFSSQHYARLPMPTAKSKTAKFALLKALPPKCKLKFCRSFQILRRTVHPQCRQNPQPQAGS